MKIYVVCKEIKSDKGRKITKVDGCYPDEYSAEIRACRLEVKESLLG